MRLTLQPLTIAEANAFVRAHHRHHGPVLSGKFAIGLNNGAKVVGVSIVGRPVARLLDDGFTAEVTRLCVADGFKNACSMLYAASWRAARAMGYRKLITYILKSESGASLSGAGWKCVGEVRGKTWHTPSRPRVDKSPRQSKLRFEATLCPARSGACLTLRQKHFTARGKRLRAEISLFNIASN